MLGEVLLGASPELLEGQNAVGREHDENLRRSRLHEVLHGAETPFLIVLGHLRHEVIALVFGDVRDNQAVLGHADHLFFFEQARVLPAGRFADRVE